ncbi:Hsp33 family molecular chaperone HslO [Luteimonas sp. SX5]|uniref:Hsp33 family molecular chaperone HslO n=1 Tax=Luteimonas galliterrae TaxID=2940486 RepID=A0ABT0MKB9_9GAMM|nr:Hsp33 family molecular chaperone HslO [Luteimonas galliterrae]MCL1635317.1 Hsp33 family molecular chaperone HslO [Luteimonas galliterrae]
MRSLSSANILTTVTDDQDRLTRFLLPHAGVRGVHVHLRQTWRQIRERAEYPPAVSELLGEAAVASALFTGHAKVEGRLSVQLRGEGPLRALFAECTAAGTLRGIAQIGGDAGPFMRDLRGLGGGAVLAITIENPSPHGRDPARYQGLVPIESEALAGAFEDYFRQSEQLPTRLLLAVDEERAAGLMLQKLPGDHGDDDGWARATALFDTLGAEELLAVTGPTLLTRLFHEEEARVLAERPLSFACSCSRERVGAVLQSLGLEEARAALQEGVAEIHCEFCGQQYRFDPDEIDALFASSGLHAVSSDRLQ